MCSICVFIGIYIYIYIYIGAAALQADPDNTFRKPSTTFIPLRRNSAITVVNKSRNKNLPRSFRELEITDVFKHLPRTFRIPCVKPSAILPRAICTVFINRIDWLLVAWASQGLSGPGLGARTFRGPSANLTHNQHPARIAPAAVSHRPQIVEV